MSSARSFSVRVMGDSLMAVRMGVEFWKMRKYGDRIITPADFEKREKSASNPAPLEERGQP
jgi:hypothetical protein